VDRLRWRVWRQLLCRAAIEGASVVCIRLALLMCNEKSNDVGRHVDSSIPLGEADVS
jgi:hypothetical protein